MEKGHSEEEPKKEEDIKYGRKRDMEEAAIMLDIKAGKIPRESQEKITGVVSEEIGEEDKSERMGVVGKTDKRLGDLEKTLGEKFPELLKIELEIRPDRRGKIGELNARVDRINNLLKEKFPETFKFIPPATKETAGIIGRTEMAVGYIEFFLKSAEEAEKKEEMEKEYISQNLDKKIEELMVSYKIEKRGVFKKTFRITDETEEFLYDGQTGKPLEFKDEGGAKEFLRKKLGTRAQEELEKEWTEKEK